MTFLSRSDLSIPNRALDTLYTSRVWVTPMSSEIAHLVKVTLVQRDDLWGRETCGFEIRDTDRPSDVLVVSDLFGS